uniref:Uncharacterized protein n=1 Tax=Glossina austeni TaxID=7395 RepID=A0A1A9UV17_GLOAU
MITEPRMTINTCFNRFNFHTKFAESIDECFNAVKKFHQNTGITYELSYLEKFFKDYANFEHKIFERKFRFELKIIQNQFSHWLVYRRLTVTKIEYEGNGRLTQSSAISNG